MTIYPSVLFRNWKTLLFFALSNLGIKAQVTLFSENMGTSGAGSNVVIGSFNSFQNSGCSYTYSGSGDVSDDAPVSSGYTGASGTNHAFLDPGEEFQVVGINTMGYSTFTITYGLLKAPDLFITNSNGTGFDIEVSTNGTAWTAIPRPNASFGNSVWIQESITTTLVPNAPLIFLRFSNNTNVVNSTDFRFDDVKITGTSTLNTQPTPYNGWPAAYAFNNWAPSSTAGTYPANMKFHYFTINSTDPDLSQAGATQDYALAYNLVCGTRIKGQNSNGISFLNTTPATSGKGNLGEAVVALNTSCRQNVQVSWKAGTIATGNIPYKLIAQYRVGNSGSYTDLPNTSITQIEYTSPASTTTFGPITLPSTCNNQPLVQVRWAYYWAGGSGTIRDEINLTDISITSDPLPLVNSVANQTVCSGKPITVSFTGLPSGGTFNWTNSNPSTGLASSGTGNISFTPPVITGTANLVANISVTSTSLTCTGPAITFSITVLAPQPSTQWSGSVSTSWSDNDNWTNCVCGSNSNATITAVTGPGFNPILNINGLAGSLTIDPGAVLAVQGAQTLTVSGNWNNNGTFAAQQGAVILNGTSAQNIGGSSATDFFDLVLNNTSGASLLSGENIKGTLLLSAGNLSTNNNLSLVADGITTGRIGPISSSADITGNVTVRQRAPGGATGWALLGSPMNSALAMSDWNDDFTITCSTCPNGFYNFTSVYGYDETAAGSFSSATKYQAITAINDPITPGKGYWVYLGNGNTSTDIDFDVTGTIAKSNCASCGSGTVNIPLSVTNNGQAIDNGWHLVSNPLPSAISWSALRNGNASVDDAIYSYNADASVYYSYVNGVPSHTPGLTDNIPMCQAFYVHATSATTLLAGENVKTNSNPTFYKQPGTTVKPVLRLVISGGGLSDLTTLYFENGGDIHYKPAFDAYKLNYDETSFPYVASQDDSIMCSINGLPELNSNLSVPIKAITPFTGSFTFSLQANDFPGDVCVTLFDTFTGITTNILTAPYTCVLYDTTGTSRFKLNLFRTILAGTSISKAPTCASPGSGLITAIGNNSGPWNFEWKQGNNVIKSSLNRAAADSLTGLNGGTYSVRINTSGQCDYYTGNFTIPAVISPISTFSADVTTSYLSKNGEINFTNLSLNCTGQTWQFGDGNMSFQANPVNYYSAPGYYDVSLQVESPTSCLSSSKIKVQIIDDVTSLSHPSGKDDLFISSVSQGEYLLHSHFAKPKMVTSRLYSMAGIELERSEWKEVVTCQIPFSLNRFDDGIYLLKVNTGTEEKTFRLLK